MKVCIAEKPSVAREIADVLGAKTKKDGFFEGNGYFVTYTFGHLCTLLEPNDYKPQWKSWDLNNLPMLPEKFDTKVVDNSGIQKQFNIIKDLLGRAEVVINCGDAGQEGELIQRWVINQGGYKGKVERLWISSLTTEAIKEGFDNLKPAQNYDNLYYAGFSRAIGDWLLGMNATRLFTVKHGGEKQVLSVGRVQTPTLAMIVERYKEIENFNPSPFWELQTVYREIIFKCEEGKFLDKEKGEVFANKVKESDFEIGSVTQKEGKEYAPSLFDLTGLQVYCNKKFSFTADETLKLVQTLYEQKVVTYPRVDTTFLPSDIYPKVEGTLKQLTKYSKYTQQLVGKPIKKSSKVFNDKKVTDHHAIIPTGVETSLNENQQKVYDIITRRFIAVFYDDCKISNTAVIGKVTDITFKATGKEMLEKGWRAVLPTEKDKKEENQELPAFTEGEKGPHEPSFLEKQTKAPNQLTEASLLRAMETAGKKVDDEEMRDLMKENGIGRPSTRANIIETLFKRKYIKRNKKQILPTPIGIQLIDTIRYDLLKSAELTGKWEKQLKEIEKGNVKAGTFINSMKKMIDHLVYEVRKENFSAQISFEKAEKEFKEKQKTKKKAPASITSEICPKCKKGTILKGKSAYGCSEYKNGCSLKLSFTFLEKKLTEKQFIRLIQKGSTTNIKGFKVDNKKVEGNLVFDENFNLKLKAKEDKSKQDSDKMICPKCKKGTILKGKSAFGCSEFIKGCDYIYSFEDVRTKAQGKEMSKELVYEILSS